MHSTPELFRKKLAKKLWNFYSFLEKSSQKSSGIFYSFLEKSSGIFYSFF